jgi:Arc/MetJ-type ribon-helix-helix transcriptional regulator
MSSQIKSGKTPVEIPTKLFQKIEDRCEQAGFDSASDYVTFVLAQLVDEDDQAGLSNRDEEMLRERLRGLGYLD